MPKVAKIPIYYKAFAFNPDTKELRTLCPGGVTIKPNADGTYPDVRLGIRAPLKVGENACGGYI